MKPRSIVYVVALLIIGIFLLANWATLNQTTEINLLFARTQAPLGVVLLIIVAAILLIDFVLHAMSWRAWTRERHD